MHASVHANNERIPSDSRMGWKLCHSMPYILYRVWHSGNTFILLGSCAGATIWAISRQTITSSSSGLLIPLCLTLLTLATHRCMPSILPNLSRSIRPFSNVTLGSPQRADYDVMTFFCWLLIFLLFGPLLQSVDFARAALFCITAAVCRNSIDKSFSWLAANYGYYLKWWFSSLFSYRNQSLR